MSHPGASSKIQYRNSRLLRMVFLQLHRQQREDLFCDVVLQAEGEAVPAHCCILSACSPFFTERLKQEMPQKGHKVVLEFRGLKIGTLRKLVDFLYTSEMEASREEAQDILAAARQLRVSELESVQLEGGKLVKKSLGRRLNRDCLQLSTPISIANVSLMQSHSAFGTHFVTSLLAAEKQGASCTKGMDNTDQNKKQKPSALLGGGKPQVCERPEVSVELPKPKLKKHSTSLIRNVQDKNGDRHIEETRTENRPGRPSLQDSKKIKLRRPKLSAAPLLTSGVAKEHSAMASGKSARPVRHVWRRKRSPSKNDEKEAEDVKCLHNSWSPPPLKPDKCRKRNPSEPAFCSTPPQEAGQVSRVKLRKVVNGSSWEVVQQSPSVQPIKAEDTALPLQEEVPCSQLRHPEQKVAEVQQAGSSTVRLPIKPVDHREENLSEEGMGKVALDETDHYDPNTFTLAHLGENKQFNSLASASELEHLLDFFLEEDDSPVASQGTAAPEEVCNPCTVVEASKSIQETTEDDGKDRHSIELPTVLQNCPLLVKPANGDVKAVDPMTSQEALGSANDSPLQNPILDYLTLVTSEPSSGRLASPPLDCLTAQKQQPVSENGPSRAPEPVLNCLSDDEDQAILSFGAGIPGAETPLVNQGLLKGTLQCTLDCKLPSLLSSLEEEELDVGVEELFVSAEYVRPDPSPVSETEVDVLS